MQFYICQLQISKSSPVPVENGKKSLSEFSIHKTVGDGIAAGADVSEKLH